MSGGRSSQNKIIEHQNKQIKQQYEMDLKNYEYSYGQKARRDKDGKLIKKKGEVVFDQMFDDDGTKAGVLNNQYDYLDS